MTSSANSEAEWEKIGDSEKRVLHCHAGLVDHASIFQRCSVIVHHGGAGTVHTTLLAQRLQVVIPLIFDQPEWARVVSNKFLGVGLASFSTFFPKRDSLVPVTPKRMRTDLADSLGDAISRCLTSNEIASGVKASSAMLVQSKESGLRRIVSVILATEAAT